MEQSIQVLVRLKPLSSEEASHPRNEAWQVHDCLLQNGEDKWQFDQVFDPTVSTQQIYDGHIQESI